MRTALLLAASALVTAAPVLQLNTTVLHGDLEWVQLTLSNGPVNDATAWLGVFAPASANVSTIAALPYPATAPWTATPPLEYIMLSSLPGGATGNLTWSIQLPQLYTDVAVKLFTGGISTPVLLASSPAIAFKGATTALRGHVARTQDPSQMLVIWQAPALDNGQRVRWGFSAGAYTHEALFEDVRTYSQDEMCGSVAATVGWFSPGYWYYAKIEGLTPGSGQRVYFSYGSDETGFSAEASFVTPVAVGPNVPTHILGIADMGVFPLDGSTDHWPEAPATQTMGHLRDLVQGRVPGQEEYSLLLHVGDVSYATGYLIKWELFMSQLAGIGDSIGYMVVMGNHERDFPNTGTWFPGVMDSGGECGVATLTRFPSPTWSRAAPDQGWWSLAHGSAFIIMLNSEMSMAPGSDQYEWLNETLASVDRTLTPWLVVAFHRPMYFVEEGTPSQPPTGIDPQFQVVESVLYAAQVDLVLVGHIHNTFVSHPVLNGTVITPAKPGGYDAPVHACIGNAGMGVTLINGSTADWVAFSSENYGYSTLNIWSASNLTMSFYANDGNQLMYTAEINRAYPRI